MTDNLDIAFIGIGNVGFALANHLNKHGNRIIIASDDKDSKSIQRAIERNPAFVLKPVQEAVDMAKIIFLAIPFHATENLLRNLRFKDQILVDCTNPVGPGISHGLQSEVSGAEKVQEWAPSAKVVKAFTIYGYENFIDSSYPNYAQKPVMLIAGNDPEAKTGLIPLVHQLGFVPKDTGALSQALHLEHMTLLWVKMVRRDGHHPNFVWGYMER